MSNKIVLIDGNSILNRAFYGIMGSKVLTTPDGKYTNAIYGFLLILFRVLEDIKPEYLMVAFDLKAPTARHKMYEGYKANRKGMPNELAEQMPILKNILKSINLFFAWIITAKIPVGIKTSKLIACERCWSMPKNKVIIGISNVPPPIPIPPTIPPNKPAITYHNQNIIFSN